MIGMFSRAKQCSPGATLCYISSRLRAKKNQRVKYLDEVDPEKREQLIRLSVSKGRPRQEQTRKHQRQLRGKMSRRMAEKRQKKTEKELRALERRLRVVNLEELAQEFPDLEASTVSDLFSVLSGHIIGRSMRGMTQQHRARQFTTCMDVLKS